MEVRAGLKISESILACFLAVLVRFGGRQYAGFVRQERLNGAEIDEDDVGASGAELAPGGQGVSGGKDTHGHGEIVGAMLVDIACGGKVSKGKNRPVDDLLALLW